MIASIPEPLGPGPWQVFMLVNVQANEGSKKQTEIRIHTYPELVKHVKNEDDSGDWAIVENMGPFTDWSHALWVYLHWSLKTRGPGPRIAHGLVLWHKYKDVFNVGLECLVQTKEEVQEVIRTRKRLRLLEPTTTTVRMEGRPLTIRDIMEHGAPENSETLRRIKTAHV